MGKDGRVFQVTLLIAVAALAYTSLSLYTAKEGEREKRIGVQKQMDALLVEKQALEVKLKDAEIAHAQAVSNIKFQDEKIGTLTKSLEEAKSANTANAALIQEKEYEVRRLKAKSEELTAERSKAMRDLEAQSERCLSMKFQLENLLKTKEEMEKMAKDLANQEGVSLGTIVIRNNS